MFATSFKISIVEWFAPRHTGGAALSAHATSLEGGVFLREEVAIP
jgi:hypothetical protein